MPGWGRYQPPSPDDGMAYAAEQRWLIAEAEIGRQFVHVAIGTVASLVATFFSALNGQLFLARAFSIAIFCCVVRVIFLIVRRHRTFIDIKIAGGMTRQEALTEMLSRYGG
jgi:hypothetical protein